MHKESWWLVDSKWWIWENSLENISWELSELYAKRIVSQKQSLDQLVSKMVKPAREAAADIVTHLMNQILAKEIFPLAWENYY